MAHNDIEILEMVMRVYGTDMQISVVDDNQDARTCHLKFKIPGWEVHAPTLPELLNRLKNNYAEMWLRHILEKNAEYREKQQQQ